MRGKTSRTALIFAAAVVVPSLVLAVLALRSVKQQKLADERQQSLLAQQQADNAARAMKELLAGVLREFAALGNQGRAPLPYDEGLHAVWPLAITGFSVDVSSHQMLTPAAGTPASDAFRTKHERVLTARDMIQIAWAPRNVMSKAQALPPPALGPAQPTGVWGTCVVEPDASTTGVCSTMYRQTAFSELTRTSGEGTISRFVDDQLEVLCWHRPAGAMTRVVGAQLSLPALVDRMGAVLSQSASGQTSVLLALRNERGIVVHASRPEIFAADTKHPLAYTNIGDELPYWQIAVYPLHTQAAPALGWFIALLVALLVVAIAVGGWLILREARREAALARQKTDFVSNVSHELKTPLTTIRMFAELLADDRVPEPEKKRQFLQTISTEAARLSRLVNDVLDFSKTSRGARAYRMEPLDLGALVTEVCADYRPRLEGRGFAFACTVPASPVMISGDRDALAQVLVNLLSNAEKYSTTTLAITVQLDDQGRLGVLDRGCGVPEQERERIFDEFHRVPQDLSASVSGSGLGLAVASRLVRDHGGDIRCEPHEGGGSAFIVDLPLLPHA